MIQGAINKKQKPNYFLINVNYFFVSLYSDVDRYEINIII